MEEEPKRYPGVMLSSTFTDLAEHRQKAIAAIQALDFHPKAMEYSGAAIGPDVLDTSLKMVADSGFYVLIIGHRYGQSPVDPARNPDKRSITELEFDEAIRRGRQILLFVMSDGHPVTKETGGWEMNAAQAKKLEAFKARAKRSDPRDPKCRVERVWESFDDKADFAAKFALAMGRLAVSQALRGSGTASPRETELIAKLTDEAQERGVQNAALVALARRVAPTVQAPEEAIAQLDGALDAYLAVRDQAARGSNHHELIDAAIRRMAEQNERQEFDEAARIGEQAYAELIEQEAALKAGKLKLAETNIAQHRMRGDAEAMAKWIVEKAVLEHGGRNNKAIFAEIRRYREEGVVRGLRLELGIAMALARYAIEGTDGDSDWPAAKIWFGIASSDLGELAGGAEGMQLLAEAVAAYRDALTVYTCDDMPTGWAMAQNNLGTALAFQGERTGGTDGLRLLAEATAAYRDALVVYTRDEVPAQWAATQNNLGNVLGIQGERASGAERLRLLAEAVTAYRDVLALYNRNHMPADWATMQNNLGTALQAQGDCTSGEEGLRLLTESVAAYRDALAVRARDDVPVQWALTQNNLGAALHSQGRRSSGGEEHRLLTEAIAAYCDALTVRTRNEMPADWAITQNNMGLAFEAIAAADAESARQHLLDAETAFIAALTIFTPEHMAHYHQKATTSLARIRAKLAGLDSPDS
jgi:tetratricopeptide (TPR) repeat protein